MDIIEAIVTWVLIYLLVSTIFYKIRKRSFPHKSLMAYLDWAIWDFNEACYILIISIPLTLVTWHLLPI